jgi:3-deoxy-7-phosphoheptulonate synthase
MIVVTKPGIAPEALDRLIERIESSGLRAHIMRGAERTVIGCIGDDARSPKPRSPSSKASSR